MAQLVIGGAAIVLFLAAMKESKAVNRPLNIGEEMQKIAKIDDGLYLTCDASAREYETLRDLGVKQILTIGKELRPHSKSTPFKMMRIDLDDQPNENISKYFVQAHQFIEQGPTIVHCFAGISRSATLIIAHLMMKYKLTVQQALAKVRAARPIVNPNPGFIEQLNKLEMNIRQGS